MIRLYIKEPLAKNQEISLSERQSHYIQNVMRLKENDHLLLFNGTDGEWETCISKVQKKSVALKILSQTKPQESGSDVWLLFSPLKPKRQEILEEKATELGVSCLWPIRCDRTSMPKINLEKMEAHVVEAAEQCGRLSLPALKPLTSLPDLLKGWDYSRLLLFGDETLMSPSLGKIEISPQKSYAFLIGPEGGFTKKELTLLRSHPQTQGVTLNPHILRAETAALAGIAYLQINLRP